MGRREGETEEEYRARKASKKEAKKSAKAGASEEVDGEPVDAPPAGGDDGDDGTAAVESEDKAARKAAKKAAKAARKAAEEGSSSSATPAGGSDEAPAQSKKRKHNDTDGPVTAGAGGLRKNFYTPSAACTGMSESYIDAFRKERVISLEDPHSSNGWAPIAEFAQAGSNFNSAIMGLTSKFKQPSPVQAQCWPIQLSGRDVVGIAATGSGKTLAFLLPAFVHIAAQRPLSNAPGQAGPVCLVLAPTRELAMQTAAVATEAGDVVGLKSLCIYGGVPKDEQRKALRSAGGVHVVTATPGRLLDLIQEGTLKLDRVTYLVLDEADRMLDMGFEKDIRAIAALLRADRQTVMFSATWPPAIQAIASEYMSSPVKVTIGHAELAASHSVTQIVEVIEPHQREARLMALLAKYHANRKNRVLCFALYKKEADRLERMLNAKGWKCVSIHGDMTQDARTRAFNAFKSGTIPLLVATDVAARGLDIPNVEYVINVTFPLTIEDYVHRIGRTGRGGQTGIAHSFFTPLDKAHSGELINVMRESGAAVPPELLKFGTHVKKKESSLYGAHFKDISAAPAAKKMKFGEEEDA